MMQMSASTAVKTVFTRKSDAERWRLLMERRPSATTSGMWLKSLSASTISDTLRAAAEPEAIETEQSASRSASTSFTPSPVMATVRPSRCRAQTSSRFCCGVTRPKTRYFAAASSSFCGVSSVEASTMRSARGTPASRAMAETVRGSSPEITRSSTPWSMK